MNYIRIPSFHNPWLIMGALGCAVGISIIVGFSNGPEWGAAITAVTSAMLSTLAIAQSWDDKRQSNRPRIVLSVERDDDDILFNLANVGTRPALNVKVSMERPILFRVGEESWEDKTNIDLTKMVGYFSNPVSLIAPGQIITTTNHQRTHDGAESQSAVIERFLVDGNEANEGVITYEDHSGRKYEETTVIGFEAFRNLNLVTTTRRVSFPLIDPFSFDR